MFDSILIYLAIGLFTGFFSGMLGIGGGSIRIPLLSFTGLPLLSSFAISMFSIPFTSAVGAYTQRKNINWYTAKYFTVGGVIGIIIATLLIGYISNEQLTLLFMFATILTILGLYLDKINRKLFDYLKPTKFNLFAGAFLGNLVIGLRGGSGGTLFPPILYMLESKMHNAIAVSLFAGIFSSLFALSIYILRGDLILFPAIIVTISGIIGVYFGSKVSMKTDSELLKIIFAAIILILAFFVFYNTFFNF